VGKAFALQSGPGPGGVDLLEMIAPVELMREFEVMEDSKDGLCNFHEGWLLSGAMLADVQALPVGRWLGTIERLWIDLGIELLIEV
jgi:hypothetical protein